jgi:hypothetical protein
MNRIMTLAAALALLGATATAVHAGTVNLGDWAVTAGSWNRVVTMKNEAPGSPTFGRDVHAGGFVGSTSGFTNDDAWVNSISLLTYCVEFTEFFSLPSGDMSGYSVVAGASYLHWGLASDVDADLATTAAADRLAISARLGRLMTHVGGLTGVAAIDTREESAAVQLAIWEIIYETPVGLNLSLTEGNLTESRSTTTNADVRTLANGLLAGSASTQSQYEVFVLTKAGKQDFIALREGGSVQQQFVPEPGAMGLSLAALGALGVAARRRRRG